MSRRIGWAADVRPLTDLSSLERARVQRRTLTVVVLAQVLGGAGLAAGVTVGALLAQQMLGSDGFAGVPTALFTVGSALAAHLVGQVSQRAGRRVGLGFGFLAGGLGAAGVVIAAAIDSVPLLFIALFVYGAGTATKVRRALESAGIQRSDAVRRERLTGQLVENVVLQERALADGDFAAFTTLASTFHRTFVEMSGNSVMLEVYDRLLDLQYLSIVRSVQRISGDPQRVLAEHRVLVADARRGDWTAFTTHLSDHQIRSHGLETGLTPE